MKLSTEEQRKLLELSTLTRAAATGAPMAISDEQQELDKLVAERERLAQAAGSAQLAVDDMELEILRIQQDERKLRRREEDDKRQLSAEVDETRRKDLTHDLYAAKSRIADLMSELQEAHNEIHALRSNVESHGARLSELDAKIESTKRAVEALPADTTAAERTARIKELREEFPAEILADFDTKREENGVGVASFNGRSCGGCFIVLPPADISAIRNAPVTELPQCSDCGSYLVRTANL